MPWWRSPTACAPPYRQVDITTICAPERGRLGSELSLPPLEDAQFFPYSSGDVVGEQSPFDDMVRRWSDHFAACGGNRVIIGHLRDSDEQGSANRKSARQPSLTIDWEWQADDDEALQTFAWSFDPLTLEPVLAIGGDQGLIYILNVDSRRLQRVLKGHGGPITDVGFSPLEPHMLASCSADFTTRIWNLHGRDLDVPPYPDRFKRRAMGDHPQLSFNFPMGRADEGDAAVAILSGHGVGGHRAQVTGLSWHPTKLAIATCSVDHTVRVWGLPEMPPPERLEGLTPLGYRPALIATPLFATEAIHGSPVQCIEWLSDDTLASMSTEHLITWQWLGYQRYFTPDSDAPITLKAQASDYCRSRSFRFLSRTALNKRSSSCQHFDVHHAFDGDGDGNTTEGEVASRCSDALIVLPASGATSSGASQTGFSIFNPLLIKATIDPPFPAFPPRIDLDACENDATDRSAPSSRPTTTFTGAAPDSASDSDFEPDAVVPSSSGSELPLFATRPMKGRRHRHRDTRPHSEPAAGDTGGNFRGQTTPAPATVFDPLAHLPSLHAWPARYTTPAANKLTSHSSMPLSGPPEPAAAVSVASTSRSSSASAGGISLSTSAGAASAAAATSTRRKRPTHPSRRRLGSAPAPTSVQAAAARAADQGRVIASDGDTRLAGLRKVIISPGGGRWILGVGHETAGHGGRLIVWECGGG